MILPIKVRKLNKQNSKCPKPAHPKQVSWTNTLKNRCSLYCTSGYYYRQDNRIKIGQKESKNSSPEARFS